tara:strand:+ start:495 stop:680 length:186 start_codon:yes stop_codon:yes gene_type:complete
MGKLKNIKDTIDSIDSTSTYSGCYNCGKSVEKFYIYPNGLCVQCQLIKDKRLKKGVKKWRI